jgi:hypothetical protein
MRRFLKIFAVSTVAQFLIVLFGMLLRIELVILPYWFVGLLIFEGLKLDRIFSDGLLGVIAMFGTPFLLVSAIVAGTAHCFRKPAKDLP